jgi:hypothetical protein
MARTILSDPAIRINNDTFAPVPNSVSYVGGFGESEIKVQSAGGGNVEGVYSENAETKRSEFKCAIYSTPENIELVLAFKANANKNFITVSGNGLDIVFRNMALVNDPEHNLSNDGQIELEFMGDQVR